MLRVVALSLMLPALAWAQAEPAPPGYVPPGHHEPEPPPPSPYKWHIAAQARLAVPLGNMPPNLAPVGYGGGIQIERALVDLGRMRLGIAGDFAYQRIPRSSDEFLSHMTFAGMLVLDGWFGRVRPWLGLGAGISVAQYRKPPDLTMPMPMLTDVSTVVPLVEGALGLDVEIARDIDIGLAGGFDFTFSSLTVGAPPVTAFEPGLFSVRLGIGFRF